MDVTGVFTFKQVVCFQTSGSGFQRVAPRARDPYNILTVGIVNCLQHVLRVYITWRISVSSAQGPVVAGMDDTVLKIFPTDMCFVLRPPGCANQHGPTSIVLEAGVCGV